MLKYQTGCFGAPPGEATTAYSPSCSTRISGVLRSLPVLAPTVISRMMGLPFMSAASAPPDSAYLSACSRDQSQGDGSYSPGSGMSTTLGPTQRHRHGSQAARTSENQAGRTTVFLASSAIALTRRVATAISSA